MAAMSVNEAALPAKPKRRRRSPRYSPLPTVAVPPDEELGPAMLALNPRQRSFVLELATGPSGYGSEIRAARAAGYTGTDASVRVSTHRTLHNQKVQDALREVGIKQIRASAFAAIRQTQRIANDIEHRDCLRACITLMDRGGFAVETHHTVTVEHKSLDDQALEALRTMRMLKASREQLEAMFGVAGLLRYEGMLADKAKPVIEEQTS
jgi:phage terminase small subunit